MIRIATVAALTLLLASCGNNEPQPSEAQPVAFVATPTPVAGPAPEVIEAAKAAILAEPGVIDLLHQPDEVFQWKIGMKSDGSYRFGRAESFCLLLKEKGIDLDKQAVRIVDFQRFMLDGDHHAASMGAVYCKTGEHSFP